VLRAIAETDTTCAYITIDNQSIEQVQQHIDRVLSSVRSRGPNQGIVLVGDGNRSSTMLIAALKSIAVSPDLFICVPDEDGIDLVMDRLSKAGDSIHGPVIIANKSKTTNLVQTAKTWASNQQTKAEIVALDNAGDFHPRDTLFYKELAELAREKLVKLGKLSQSAALQMSRPRRASKSANALLGFSTVFIAVLVGRKINFCSNPGLKYRSQICAVLLFGLLCGTATALIVSRQTNGVSVAQNHSRNTSLSSQMAGWRLSDTRLDKLNPFISLTDYSRKLASWKLDERIHRAYVLSPDVAPGLQPELQSRLSLWKFFYPLVRRAKTPLEAANVLVQNLRLEIEIRAVDSQPLTIEQIWSQHATTQDGFEAVYVAALRSIAIASRLNAQGQAELWDDGEWKPAPRPAELVTL
jgi:hypothetical protein